MKRSIQILIVDDHPMTVRGYEMALVDGETDYCLEIEGATSCDEVLEKMKYFKRLFFDIVLLDISLPPSSDNSVISGEDLGLRVRRRFPSTKIIVHTALNNQERISNIFKSLNPEGFVIKSDLEPEVLTEAINSVLDGQVYYSKRINQLIGHGNYDGIFLDPSDQKILYHLSKGERMKNLTNHVPLAMATIERRKKKMKSHFGIPKGSDVELLDIAREKGFI